MTIHRAVEVLQDELMHTRQHLQFKGKADVYYKELGEFANALEIAISALQRQEADDG